MDHCMVDIETLDTRPSGVILSIGAVKFDFPALVDLEDTFYVNISIASSLKADCTVEGRTIQWWFSQSKAAQTALFKPEPIGFHEALSAFRRWYGERPLLTWSHGSNFDLTLIGAAYDKLGQQPPWKYRDVRDTRTLFWLAPGYAQAMERTQVREMNFVRHNALDDAKRQVQWVQTAIRLLKEV